MTQKTFRVTSAVMVFVASLISFKYVLAATAPSLVGPAGLSLVEIKITGNEFIMLQNNSGAIITDLDQYWLYGFNNSNPLSSGVSSSSQQLPSAILDKGQTLLLSSVGGATCGAAVTAKLSIGLGDSGGYLEVVKTGMVNNLLTQTAGDAVSWSSGINAVAGMISKQPSNTADPGNAWYRYHNSLPLPPYLWQQAELNSANNCQLNAVIAGSTVAGPTSPGNKLLPSLPPPATIVSVDAVRSESGLPSTDIGLRAPQLTELLPNPASPQSDSKDEFIEIYNPNSVGFDLTGFKLQTASSAGSTKHTYTFSSGTKIAAKHFAAYPSSNISVSLANTSGLVWLLDPSDKVISQTEAYTVAKEGTAWALADGKWYWTSTPTPNVANVITATSSNKKTSGSGVGTVLGTSTAKTATSFTNSADSNASKSRSLNSAVLVGVGVLAIMYGIYEYRRDLANAIYKFKRNRTVRRENRPKT